MKQEEGKKKENKKGKMVKRQVSVITIFLWIFLVTTMITITTSSIRKNNSIVEIDDENWNVSLVMYDRSSDTPTQAITDFTWNATSNSEAKELVMQINYNCTTGKAYNKGELVIEIPGMGIDSFSEYWRNAQKYDDTYDIWLKDNIIIAADKISDITKKYDWSYTYNKNSNMYTFTNNSSIVENEHFEGTIQIVCKLKPRFRIQTELEFKAKLRENKEGIEEVILKESNICNFHYTSTKRLYSLENCATSAPKKDYTKIENILDNYYWVEHFFDVSSQYKAIAAYSDDNIIMKDEPLIKDIAMCIKIILPEGCVLYDKNLEKIESRGDNAYYYLKGGIDNFEHYYYYIGYPKENYNEGEEITNVAELWGRYEDEEKMEKLAESSTNVKLKENDFEYKGSLYYIGKYNNYNSRDMYATQIKYDKSSIYFADINFNSFYTENKQDVEIGDDLLYILRENGELTKLNDDEYNFTKIEIPAFYTYNKYSGGIGEKIIGYNYEVQVRYKDTNEYVVYKEGIKKDSFDIVEFDREDIVGVKVVIKDLDKTLYSCDIKVFFNIFTQDLKISQNAIYNFAYLQVYQKDEDGNRTLINEPENKSTGISVNSKVSEISDYDKNVYGAYMQRASCAYNIVDGKFQLGVSKYRGYYNRGEIENNVAEKKYTFNYTLKNNLVLNYYEVNRDVIIKQYDILPSGINLVSSKEEIKNSITTDLSYKNLKLKDGTLFNSKEELETYIKNNATVDIDYNYKNSGRAKISIIYNLNEIDWSYYLIDKINADIDAIVSVEIPYDSILEYGTNYTNWLYGMWDNQEYSYGFSKNNDNGTHDILASDIDNDGDTEESLTYGSNTFNITHAVSSQQAVIKQVRTDLTKGAFVEGTAEATAGSEYTYKLRITTGANSLKDLILYDTLETTYDESGNEITEGWKGEFLGVNTEYAVSKGYAPKVYYSEEKNPGKLTEVPDKWKELTDDVDKTKVKSICVDLRYKSDGSEMELSPNNVVFVLVNMKAPNDDTLLTSSHNMFSTNWRAIDPLGGVIDNIEGIYSNEVNVEIHKKDVRKEISGTKTWEDENNKYGVRPESIKVKLLQDGQEYETKTVTAGTNWNYTFENVPVYKSNTSMYEYEIVEETIPTYEVSYEENNITNSIKLKDLEVTKLWNDNNNESEKRPDSVILQVYDSDILISEAEVNESTNWKHTFTNLLKYRENGEEITYTINEKSFVNDKFYVKEINGNTITNTFTVPEDKIKIVGTKVWNDENNKAGKRTDSITLQVKENGVVVTEQEVTENDNWSYEFELTKYDSLGNERNYTIDEKDTGNKFYKKELTNSTTVTNIFEVPNETVNVEVVKVWNDKENEAQKRPESIKLQVKAKGAVVDEFEVNDTNEWKHTFTLPKYDSLGDEITYTIDEDFISEFYVKSIVGNTITNTFTVPEDKIKIVGTKVWNDLNNFAEKRDESVTLQLIGDGEVITEQIVNEANNWTIEAEVPKYDRYGNEIEYHIDERDTGNKFYKKELTDELTVTNIFEVPSDKKSIEVMKVWDDDENEANKRPTSIKLQIKRNGTVVEEAEVNESTSWKHTFELQKYDERGNEIEYTVDEDFVSEFYIKNIVGYVITNTFVVPEDITKITGVKVWEDNGNAGGKRDDRVFLQLKNEKDEVISEAEISDKNNWSYEFEVSKYDSLGNIVKYHIDERDTKNKFYAKELTDSNTVTNKFVVPDEKVLVKAVKVWDDKNNSAGKRPNNVTLQIYNKDVLVTEKKVSETDNWNFEVELPKYDELGEEITYTVDEKETSKYYEKEVAGNIVTNRLMYELPNTSDINVFMYVVIFFIAIIGIIVGILFIIKNKKE